MDLAMMNIASPLWFKGSLSLEAGNKGIFPALPVGELVMSDEDLGLRVVSIHRRYLREYCTYAYATEHARYV